MTDYYRCINREMLSQSGERTFITTVLPPGAAWVNTTIGHAFQHTDSLLAYFAFSLSLVVDFRVKSTGMGHANKSLVSQLPVDMPGSPFRTRLNSRALALTCISSHYATLWEECFEPKFGRITWSQKSDGFGHSVRKEFTAY